LSAIKSLNKGPKALPGGNIRRVGLLRRAFVDSLPVLMGYSTMGFAAGVLMGAKADVPFSPLWGMLSAASFVSGTLSFAIVPLLASSAPLAAVAMLTLAINFRYAFYGISMLTRWKNVPILKKLFLIHLLTDENYALETASTIKDPAQYERYCILLSTLNLSYWIFGVTSGCTIVWALEKALSPERIKASTQGIEFAMVALFIVIFTQQIKEFFNRGK
jgi:4-azaleucine resistance transporter AzlC